MHKPSLTEAVSGVLFCSFLLLAPAAKAEPVALACVGAEAASFNPGLLLFPQEVSFSSLGVSGCSGIDGGPRIPAEILSAVTVTGGQGSQSCLLASSPSEITIEWSDGTSSVARGNSVVNLKPLGQSVIVVSATVVSGRFLGANVVRTLVLLNTNLLGCLFSPGITDVAGPTALVVTGL